MNSAEITLSTEEIEALTGYTQCTRQLAVLRARGFYRAYIARKGGVVLERAHYEAVSRGEDAKPATIKKTLKISHLTPA